MTKDWRDYPDLSTPIDAAAAEQMETDWQAYADAKAAGGVLLDYASITSSATRTGPGSTDPAGLSITVTVGTRPILLVLSASSLYNSSGSGVGAAALYEGATKLGAIAASLTTLLIPCYRARVLTPSAGSHTYKVTLSQWVTGDTTLSASADDPASIYAFEI